MIYGCYSGPHEKVASVLDPTFNFGTPIQSGYQTNDYVTEQRAGHNSDPRANGSYLKSGFVSEISDGLIDAIVDGFDASPERNSQLFFQCSGEAPLAASRRCDRVTR